MKKFIIVFVIFAFDRATKFYLIDLQSNGVNIDFYVNSFLNFNLHMNTGIGFGLFSLEAGLYYNILSIIICLVILTLIIFMLKSSLAEKLFFSFIIGGALGNLYDRIIFKAVPDFIDFHVKEFHWFSFNVADIFISLGIIFMILNEIIFKNQKNEN